MTCINCNGTMHGDGYSLPITCENLDEQDSEWENAEYAAPDEGPFYCDFNGGISELDALEARQHPDFKPPVGVSEIVMNPITGIAKLVVTFPQEAGE